MYKYYLAFTALFLVFTAFKADKPAYLIFDKDGKPEKYDKMMKALNDADIVLFGELHDNPISHWLELEVTKDMFESAGDKLILGAEMFETDNRLILSEYVEGLISSSRFEDEAKLWPNYKTDYKPLVEFARKEKIPFVATNVPRRYASLVNSDGLEGLDKLSDDAKALLPPLPIAYDSTLNCYASMLKMEGMGSHVNANFPKAQALKDATMANSILQNWKPGKKLLHYHGAYHSQNFESIYWYLKHYQPELKIVTIHSVTQKDISELEKENTGQADFTICVDEDMTRTR